MTFVDAFLFVGLVLFGLPLAVGIGRLLAWATKLRFFRWLVPTAVAAVLFVVGPIYMDVAGVPALGRVKRKNERIQFLRDGGYARRLSIDVLYQPRGFTDSIEARVGIGVERFDRIAVGSPIELKYLRERPGFVKVADRAPFAWMREAIPRATMLRVGILLILAMGIAVALWGGKKGAPYVSLVRRPFVLLAIAAWVAGAALTFADYLNPPREPPTTAAAVGKVRGVRRVTETWLSSGENRVEAPRPFDVVEIEYAPGSTAGPIIGVDAIDTGTVRGLAYDAVLPLHYAPANPRVVHLDGGTRDFRGPNNRAAWLGLAGSLGVVALGVGVIAVLGRRRRAH
jgi:hypothetical protein